MEIVTLTEYELYDPKLHTDAHGCFLFEVTYLIFGEQRKGDSTVITPNDMVVNQKTISDFDAAYDLGLSKKASELKQQGFQTVVFSEQPVDSLGFSRTYHVIFQSHEESTLYGLMS